MKGFLKAINSNTNEFLKAAANSNKNPLSCPVCPGIVVLSCAGCSASMSQSLCHHICILLALVPTSTVNQLTYSFLMKTNSIENPFNTFSLNLKPTSRVQ
jgi:hypothetical protein